MAACAPRLVAIPTDPGTPLPGFAETYRDVTAACAGVRTLTAELGLSGRAAGSTLRGRVIAGFERPGSMRLEGVAPFGPPGFILVARGDDATLLLPRDDRVLRGAPPEAILGAMTGVALAPADLQAILTGCVSAAPRPIAGRLHDNGWASIALAGGSEVYLAPQEGGWQLRAARLPGWRIDYPAWEGRFPHTVRLTSLDGPDVDVTATVSQLETNIDLPSAEAFSVNIPPDALDLTLAELRAAGPLRPQ